MPHPKFNAGHPVRERNNDHRDEVDEWEIFTHDRPISPHLSALAWAILESENTRHIRQNLTR